MVKGAARARNAPNSTTTTTTTTKLAKVISCPIGPRHPISGQATRPRTGLQPPPQQQMSAKGTGLILRSHFPTSSLMTGPRHNPFSTYTRTINEPPAVVFVGAVACMFDAVVGAARLWSLLRHGIPSSGELEVLALLPCFLETKGRAGTLRLPRISAILFSIFEPWRCLHLFLSYLDVSGVFFSSCFVGLMG